MKWRDAVVMASRELRRRTGRAVLTVLAIALAAALLSALLAIAGTARTRVLSQLSHGGSLAGITVQPDLPNPSQETLDDPVPGPSNPITAGAIARIARLPDVSGVYTVTTAPAILSPPSQPPAGSILCPPGPGSGGLRCPTSTTSATTPRLVAPFESAVVSANLAHVGALPVTLLAGRLPAASSQLEVDVGSSYLQKLGLSQSRASEVVGTRIALASQGSSGDLSLVRSVRLEIVGVVNQQLGTGDVVAWPSVVNGLDRFADAYDPGAGSHYDAAVVIARQLSEVATVRLQIDRIGYSSTAPVGLIISVGRYLHVVELVLSGIGIVALGIAALGIANALFAAVRERRREIGVLKAIGARDRDVLRIFLVEAAALGVLGGIVGTLLGIAMAAAISANANAYLHSQGLAGVALSVPWLLPAGAIVGSTVIALAAGLFPARRAARLPARDAVDI